MNMTMTRDMMTRICRFCIWMLAVVVFPVAGWAQSTITVYDANIGKDESMDLPEGMLEVQLDSMMREWNARVYLNYDGSNCFSTGENKSYSPEEYERRLYNLPNVVEMPYNSVVQKFIDQYSDRMRRSVSIMLGASNFYTPIFEDALESYGVPLELKFLPIIESALNPCATSRAGAAGLWQFMPTTGKKYGLEITSLVDERRDPVKASYAAARMLKELYGIFGDWTLVIASYNCGPGNVVKAIKRAGGIKDYWTIYPYLPRETRGYVPAFIAANYIMNYYCEHNICPAPTRLPMGTDTVVVTRDVSLAVVSERCNIALDELKALNPQYRTNRVPGGARPCSLRMPTEAINAFIEAGDSIYEASSLCLLPRAGTTMVLDGESLSPDEVRTARRGSSGAVRSAKYTRSRGTYRRQSGRNYARRGRRR